MSLSDVQVRLQGGVFSREEVGLVLQQMAEDGEVIVGYEKSRGLHHRRYSHPDGTAKPVPVLDPDDKPQLGIVAKRAEAVLEAIKAAGCFGLKRGHVIIKTGLPGKHVDPAIAYLVRHKRIHRTPTRCLVAGPAPVMQQAA